MAAALRRDPFDREALLAAFAELERARSEHARRSHELLIELAASSTTTAGSGWPNVSAASARIRRPAGAVAARPAEDSGWIGLRGHLFEQLEIPQVDEEAHALADDEDRILTVDGIAQ